MRLGINGNLGSKNPEEWIQTLKKYRLRTAVMPIGFDAPIEERKEYLRLAAENDIVIGEVGIWKNVLNPDPVERKKTVEFAKKQLAYADEVGARCCVNVAGAVGERWDGYYPENYSQETYERIIDVTREIIDAVKPVRTYFTLEPMYWMHPDSPEDYKQMILDVDRERFAVHMDYANMITSMTNYHNCDAFINKCFDILGPYVKSVHAKDVVLLQQPTVCIREALPGTGRVNFRQVFELCHGLDHDMPVFAEHLHSMEDYAKAISYMQSVWEGS